MVESIVVKTWKGAYTVRRKDVSWTNVFVTQQINNRLFIEVGHRTGEQPYHYVSLMEGNYKHPKDAKQLYFAHAINGVWWLYSDDALTLVEKVGTQEEAIRRLKELAKKS